MPRIEHCSFWALSRVCFNHCQDIASPQPCFQLCFFFSLKAAFLVPLQCCIIWSNKFITLNLDHVLHLICFSLDSYPSSDTSTQVLSWLSLSHFGHPSIFTLLLLTDFCLVNLSGIIPWISWFCVVVIYTRKLLTIHISRESSPGTMCAQPWTSSNGARQQWQEGLDEIDSFSWWFRKH